ncbi:hypothetical protein NQ317_000656 [Molorchus minor]|uniref:THAP-type domain-containing protein n=1 Tax=Molorchus minor TaxID=1323400 RepID=A0ABQ9J322_9CUCU|nr:hypothetical protein NQ317_000656 [Molorchus minor]
MEFEEKAPSKNKTFCCVYGCNSKAERNRKLSFHLFPMPGKRKVEFITKLGICEKIDIHKAWMLKLKMGKPASRFMRVCSAHFTSDDYKVIKSGPGCAKFLKWNAVPSVNLPVSHIPSREPSKRKTRKKILETQHDLEDEKALHDPVYHNDLQQLDNPTENVKYTEDEKISC